MSLSPPFHRLLFLELEGFLSRTTTCLVNDSDQGFAAVMIWWKVQSHVQQLMYGTVVGKHWVLSWKSLYCWTSCFTTLARLQYLPGLNP